MTNRATTFFLWGLVLAPVLALASDPPHWSSTSPEGITIDCSSACHTGHQALGGTLTQAADNVNLCQSCHNTSGLADTLPLNDVDKAMPGTSGTSHGFDVPAVNATYGTVVPSHTGMSQRVMGGNVVCSTCHNQHQSSAANGGRARISPPKKILDNGGTGTLTSGGTYTDTASAWYTVKITTAGDVATARFQYKRYTEAAGWTAWSSDIVPGTDVALDNGVVVTFSGGASTYALDDMWELYAGFPFLRKPLDNAAGTELFCRDCHTSFVWSPAQVQTHDVGVKKGHPTGIALGGGAFDRAAPLDANGAAQGGGGEDTNPTNDLKLYGGTVQCLTCHGVHFADSNSQTVDGQ